MAIREDVIYTPKEVQEYLKVSQSTMTRMLKKGLIRSARIGKQYRIMGKEILRVISPSLEDKVGVAYNKARRWAHDESAFSPPPKNVKGK
ncbi:MAG: helix-turn-helix domain-containing protein [Candidatus Omnitrophota bacterium]|jgi:excisionase family DNA binding protein